MKKIAIVGVEGSGKTVMLAGLGDLYSKPDDNGYFLSPKNFGTASYVSKTIRKMREGSWPAATAGDEMQGLDWTLRQVPEGRGKPTDVSEVSFLDFAGEVYRVAFGIKSDKESHDQREQVEALKRYIDAADEVIVLINLRDIIVRGIEDERVIESMWITNSILDYAMQNRGEDEAPRAAIVLSQADSYADTIGECGGALGVLRRYLPHLANNYGWLDIFTASAVDKTVLDDDGMLVPDSSFSTVGLQSIMDWILDSEAEEEYLEEEEGPEEDGDTEDSEESFDRLLERAQAGDAEAQCELGNSYYNSDGVDAGYEVAVTWFREAAEQGYAEAQYKLGLSYDYGRGVEKNLNEAIKWYRKAAEQGHARAQYCLGSAYEEGRGVKRNFKEAKNWYCKAAEQGAEYAQNALRRFKWWHIF